MTTPRRTVIVACLFVGLFGLAYGVGCAFQERMIFPREYANARVQPIPAHVESLWITAADGTRVEGWFVPGAGIGPDRPGPLLMFFHGNGELIDTNLAMAELYRPWGVSVLLAEYRGYGRSQGDPSQAAIVADMVQFHDTIAARPDVDPQRIAYHGRSLGGGVAAALGAARPPPALILESTFTSLAAVARSRGLLESLCRHPFHTDRVLPGLDRPVLILHGADDELIPPAHARRLHALTPDSQYVELPGHHNDFPGDPAAYTAAIREFLRVHLLATG
jgi:fermentation-respiration switch protein FrsA (DUF1100 family)